MPDEFVLLIVGDERLPGISVKEARSLVDRGAIYICAWGPHSDDFEETFDHASFLPECGPELSFTLMTTSHRSEPLEEALFFALYATHSPHDPDLEIDNIVIVVASEELNSRCYDWLMRENQKS